MPPKKRRTPFVPAKVKPMLDEGQALYTIERSPRAILCHVCGSSSSNPNDIAHRFCGSCKIYFEDVLQAYAILNRNKES